MKQIKDLIICLDFFPEMGGAHTWIYEVYKRWPGPACLLAKDYAWNPGLKSRQLNFDALVHGNLDILRLPIRLEEISCFDIECIRQFSKLLWKVKSLCTKRPVRIHCLRAFPDGIAAVLYKRVMNKNTRVITYVHGEELNVARTSRQLEFFTRQVLSGSDLIIVNSQATKECLHNFMAVTSQIKVIHPGVDAQAYRISSKPTKELRKKWGCTRDDIVLITVARMEPRKNHTGVLKALALLRDKGLKLKYIMAGSGPEHSKLARLVRTLGLETQVCFAGVINEKEKIASFKAADIHVMPSIDHGSMIEGFGIVFIEAAAAGIPSIGGNSGGQAEAVRHKETGLIVDGKNVGDLSIAIEGLARDQAMRRSMGKKGQLFAMENDWEKIAAATWEFVGQ